MCLYCNSWQTKKRARCGDITRIMCMSLSTYNNHWQFTKHAHTYTCSLSQQRDWEGEEVKKHISITTIIRIKIITSLQKGWEEKKRYNNNKNNKTYMNIKYVFVLCLKWWANNVHNWKWSGFTQSEWGARARRIIHINLF